MICWLRERLLQHSVHW